MEKIKCQEVYCDKCSESLKFDRLVKLIGTGISPPIQYRTCEDCENKFIIQMNKFYHKAKENRNKRESNLCYTLYN